MSKASIPLPAEIRERILERVADSSSPRDAATLVLDSLVEERVDAMSCSLDEVKQLLVDALRVSRHAEPSSASRRAG